MDLFKRKERDLFTVIQLVSAGLEVLKHQPREDRIKTVVLGCMQQPCAFSFIELEALCIVMFDAYDKRLQLEVPKNFCFS